MEKYKKGKNVEEPLEKTQIPIKNLPDDFLWMHVKPGTKMRNVLDYASAELKSHSAIVWSGSGAAVGKVISCAEIMKRQHQLHQVNKICFHRVKEYWDPLLEDLDPLVVLRDVPTLHILLSKLPLDTSQPGYQAPTNKSSEKKHNPRQQNKSPRRRIDTDKFESFGLRSARTKHSKRRPTDQRGNFAASQKTEMEKAKERKGEGEKEKIQRGASDAKPGPSGVG